MKILKLLLFNYFSKRTYKDSFSSKMFGRRLQAIQNDISYFTVFFAPFIIIFFVSSIINDDTTSLHSELGGILKISLIVTAFIMLNKDFVNGQSIGKRVQGYRIVEHKTGETPQDFKIMLRNFTYGIWPIEALFLLFNPERRLGDFLAGTKVINCEPTDPENILKELKEKQFDTNSKLTLLLSALLAWVIFNLPQPIILLFELF